MHKQHWAIWGATVLAMVGLGSWPSTTAHAHVLNQQTALRRRVAQRSGMDLATVLRLDKTLSKQGIHLDSVQTKDQSNQYQLHQKRHQLTVTYTVTQTPGAATIPVQVIAYQDKQAVTQTVFTLGATWNQDQLTAMTYVTKTGATVDLLSR